MEMDTHFQTSNYDLAISLLAQGHFFYGIEADHYYYMEMAFVFRVPKELKKKLLKHPDIKLKAETKRVLAAKKYLDYEIEKHITSHEEKITPSDMALEDWRIDF